MNADELTRYYDDEQRFYERALRTPATMEEAHAQYAEFIKSCELELAHQQHIRKAAAKRESDELIATFEYLMAVLHGETKMAPPASVNLELIWAINGLIRDKKLRREVSQRAKRTVGMERKS